MASNLIALVSRCDSKIWFWGKLKWWWPPGTGHVPLSSVHKRPLQIHNHKDKMTLGTEGTYW